uniref:Zinc finger, CCHC-type n=1 Tax=Tanacetum cinerariifolium TaxID=118510 RepID=A0A6L2KWK9_TANCI|nr:zinc finger, CCHC-type [Tanacetum cinerariifolium]
MGDENPIRTLEDYSKPSHKGYRNTIKLPGGNNVAPLRSDTIRLVQNECSFHGLRFEDPNQHLKDFLKLMDSLDLNGENRERTRMRLFQFSFCDQASNWLERLPAGSITTWEDLTTCFLAQFFPLGRTTTLQRYIMENLYVKHGLVLRTYYKNGLHDTQYCMEDPKQAFVDYASARTDGTRSRQFTANQGPRNFNKAANSWKGKPDFNLAPAQTFTSPQNGSFSTYLSSYQTKLERALIDFDAHQEKRLSKLISRLLATPQERSFKARESKVHQIILKKEDEVEEEGNAKTSKTEYEDHGMTVESEEEFEEETEDKIKEEDEDSLKQFDTFPTKKELRLGLRKKPSNPRMQFCGKGQGAKSFVRNFTYECDFMVLEDTTSVIDHDIGLVIFGKPFVEANGLIYDREEGTITFEKDKENIVFKMPHKMEMFKHIDFTDMNTDRIPPFVIKGDDDSSGKTYYSNSLDLGPKYKHDENMLETALGLTPDGVTSP